MLARVLALLLALCLTTQAQAEPRMMGIALQCDNEAGKIITMVQEKYQEIPFATAQGLVQNITGKWQAAEVVVFMHPESRSFSVILIDPNSGTECLLLAGQGFTGISEVLGDPL
jgi:hypothetical protein